MVFEHLVALVNAALFVNEFIELIVVADIS